MNNWTHCQKHCNLCPNEPYLTLNSVRCQKSLIVLATGVGGGRQFSTCSEGILSSEINIKHKTTRKYH